jgi:hypothetical protein
MQAHSRRRRVYASRFDDEGVALSIESFRIQGKEIVDEGSSDSNPKLMAIW